MGSPAVIFDACVLYPAPLRDFLVQLAITGMFRAKWTDEIHDEWIRNLLLRRPDLTEKDLHRTRDLMDLAVPDCKVADYQPIISTLEGMPDLDDRHVLAAAIKSDASIIVTFNLKDFPSSVLDAYGVQAMHPDNFMLYLFSINQSLIVDAILEIVMRLKNPPTKIEDYIQLLVRQGLKNSAPKAEDLIVKWKLTYSPA